MKRTITRTAIAAAALLAFAVPANADVHTDVVGGTDAQPNTWQFTVALLKHAEADPWKAQFCGGTVVDSTHIVTAAHCFIDPQTGAQDVQAGDVDILAGTQDLLAGLGQRIPVAKVLLHPGYSNTTKVNDVAVLVLSQPTSAPTLRPARAADNSALANTLAWVAGWGQLAEGDNAEYPTHLKQAQVPIATDAACSALVRGFSQAEMLCAGYQTGGIDTCQGDSGGPFVTRAADGTWVLTGIVSWGIGCARPNVPGVYTRVSSYEAFIAQGLATTADPAPLPGTPALPGIPGGGAVPTPVTPAPVQPALAKVKPTLKITPGRGSIKVKTSVAVAGRYKVRVLVSRAGHLYANAVGTVTFKAGVPKTFTVRLPRGFRGGERMIATLIVESATAKGAVKKAFRLR